MESLLRVHLVISVLGAGLLLGFQSQFTAWSFFVGSMLVLANLLLLSFAWRRILEKKRIALAGSVIVLKYAVFSFIIYWIVTSRILLLEWFTAGLSMVLITALVAAVRIRTVLDLEPDANTGENVQGPIDGQWHEDADIKSISTTEDRLDKKN